MDSAYHLVPGGFIAPDGRFRPSISGAEDAPDPVVTDPPAGPDIAALLADENAGDTPLTVAQLKPFLEAQTGVIAERERERIRAERAEQDRIQRESDERNSTRKSDRDWALDLDRRLDSRDEAVRAQALADKEGAGDRYRRGLAVAYEDDSNERQIAAVNAHLSPRLAHLQGEGQQAFLDKLADAQWFGQFGGNELLAAIKFGDEAGYQRGLHEAEEAADQARRTVEASQGGPGGEAGGGGGGAAGGRTDLWEGIDRSKPGAAAEYQRRLNASQTQAQRR